MRTVVSKTKNTKGMTLVEVTLVIAVILSLVGILFMGVSAYKAGSDRAFCIINIEKVQRALRSWSNMGGYRSGDSVTNLKAQLIGTNRFLTAEPSCPASGIYTYGGDTVPDPGTVYLQCSIGDHAPPASSGW